MSTLRVSHDESPAVCTIGPSLEELQSLAAIGVEAVPTLCISKETLHRIAVANNLEEKLKAIWEETVPHHSQKSLQGISAKVTTVFERIHIPDDISNILLKHVHGHFETSYLNVYASSFSFTHAEYCHENVHGDANLVHSIMTIWQKLSSDYIRQIRHTFTTEMVVPDSIIIQQSYAAKASGVAYTKHPLTEDKTQIVIRSIQGIQSLKDQFEKTDTFTIDTRTWNVINTKKSTQTIGFTQKPDGFATFALSPAKQDEISLNQDQAVTLAHIIRKIKLKFPQHKKIWWQLYENRFIILGLRTFEVFKPEVVLKKHKSLTKVLVIADGLSEVTSANDGIGLLKGDYFLTEMGVHPLFLIKGKHANTYLDSVTKKIQATLNKQLDPFTLYQPSQYTSNEFKMLLHGNNFELDEENPFLGFRGASRTYLHPEIFQFELHLCLRLLENYKNTFGLNLSWVRTPNELVFLIEKIKKQGLFEQKNFQAWWQITTPENILNLDAYPLENISGIVINIETLTELSLGIDPKNYELLYHYGVSTPFMEKIMASIKKQLESKNLPPDFQVFVLNPYYNNSITRTTVELGFNGVIVGSDNVAAVHEQICDTESNTLTNALHSLLKDIKLHQLSP